MLQHQLQQQFAPPPNTVYTQYYGGLRPGGGQYGNIPRGAEKVILIKKKNQTDTTPH